MRKILVTYIPASLFLVFLAMGIFLLGGCGGDGVGETQQVPPNATLTGLSINGPSSMNETGTATYMATASWSDDSTSTVTPEWNVDSQMVSISSNGELSCHGIANNQIVTITAEYSLGGITETATMDVTINKETTTLTGLSINGPSSMGEFESASYTALASWSDGSTSMVTPTWSVNPQMAEIDTDGVLSCRGGVASDQMVTVRAAYSSGGIAKSDTIDVTIRNVPTIPFTGEEVSGNAFFQEDSEGEDYHSFLYILNVDSSLDVYWLAGLPRGDASSYWPGTWSNDPDGLFLDFRLWGFGPAWVYRTADSTTDMEVLLYQKIWASSTVVTWEKTVPVDPRKLPGTYAGSDGYTWVFNADGTGSVPDFGVGGLTFTWSVGSEGCLRMPTSMGHTPVFYARATSQSTATEYTILKVGFVELTRTGAFFKYYGGIELTRQ